MEYRLQCEPGYSLVECELAAGEQIVGDAGAMAWMSPTIQTETTTRGGILKGLRRAALGGESFFQNTYTAVGAPGAIAFAPGCAGGIVPHELRDGELLLQKSAYLASSTDIHCDSKWQGLKGFFSEGLFVLRVTGTGLLFFASYGCVHEIEVNGEYTLDNGYAVAWEPSLSYRITRANKIRSFLFSDQLLVRFSGRGKLWAQSRSAHSLANWVYPFRPVKTKSSND